MIPLSVIIKRKVAGLALVETTIVLPLLFFLMIACVEIGRVLYLYNTANKLTRDGARFLTTIALDSNNTMDLSSAKISRVRNFIIFGNEAGAGASRLADLALTDITLSSSAGNLVTININYQFTPIFSPSLNTFGYGGNVSLNFPLQTEVSMRALN